MVGSRWESSTRPLFVRAVWQDGHHHVVLRKDDAAAVRVSRSARRSISSVLSRKTLKSSSPTRDNSLSFRVPTVKLLLAGLRGEEPRAKRFRPEHREFVNRAITVEVVPRDSVRYSDINRQVAFKNEKIRVKARSVEVEKDLRSPPPFSYDDYCAEQFNNTLSDRVMMWLDLAIQNQQLKISDLKKRVLTAQATPNNIVFERNEQKTTTAPLVTSRVECGQYAEEICKEKERTGVAVSVSRIKRQLHIFMPHLPKKTSESSSFMSSKTSSSRRVIQ